jgi:hypothetical protein
VNLGWIPGLLPKLRRASNEPLVHPHGNCIFGRDHNYCKATESTRRQPSTRVSRPGCNLIPDRSSHSELSSINLNFPDDHWGNAAMHAMTLVRIPLPAESGPATAQQQGGHEFKPSPVPRGDGLTGRFSRTSPSCIRQTVEVKASWMARAGSSPNTRRTMDGTGYSGIRICHGNRSTRSRRDACHGLPTGELNPSAPPEGARAPRAYPQPSVPALTMPHTYIPEHAGGLCGGPRASRDGLKHVQDTSGPRYGQLWVNAGLNTRGPARVLRRA